MQKEKHIRKQEDKEEKPTPTPAARHNPKSLPDPPRNAGLLL